MNDISTIIFGIAALIDAMVACCYALTKLIDYIIEWSDRKNGKK